MNTDRFMSAYIDRLMEYTQQITQLREYIKKLESDDHYKRANQLSFELQLCMGKIKFLEEKLKEQEAQCHEVHEIGVWCRDCKKVILGDSFEKYEQDLEDKETK